MSNIPAERRESIKIGILGGSLFFLTYIIFIIFNYFILFKVSDILLSFNLNFQLNLALKLGISFFTGFLFAVTYRYIIRTDDNSHLKDGAVLAFGLIRGLVFIEISDNLIENIFPIMILIIESIINFLITRLGLDFAFSKKIISPFY